MSNIDERIVQMTFKNADFLKNASATVSALAKLKSSLNFQGAADSLNQIDEAGKKFSLSGLLNGVEQAGSKFNLLSVLGVSALATIAAKAVSAGISLVKSFTIQPIMAGLDVYQTKINAIQTILANTQSEGTNLKQVTGALDELNTYANKTVYNFGEMTKNIGTFTAAGVDLKTSVSSIKGIANLAALSGSSAEQASGAMYQLSQAIAAGKVNLQDWNSVVNAGLGGKVFQNALEQTARATGVNIDAIIKKAGSFRNSLQQGWLTTKILTQTLSTFTGDLSAKQLKAMGYTAAEIKQIQAQAQAAVNSATQIRTVTQLHQALAEEVATAWSHVWEVLIGNIGEATSTLTAVHNVLENAFTKPVYDLANLLQQWDKLGGRDELIQAITDAFRSLGAILKPIGQAFRDVFPPVTAMTLINMTVALERFTEGLRPTKTEVQDIRNTFDGLFSIVKIVVDVLVDVIKGMTGVGGAAKSSAAGVLGITGSIGKYLSNLRQTIEQNANLKKALEILGKVLISPITLLGKLASAAGGIGPAFAAVWRFIQPFVDKVGAAFSGLGKAIANSIHTGDFSNVLSVLNQGLFGLILLQIKKFFTGITKATPKASLMDTIKESFEGLTNTLKSMQENLKSSTLLKIAAAVGILTASVIALSFINVNKLNQALIAITLMFTELLAGMAIISKISGLGGIAQIAVIAASLNLLATAIFILAGAVVLLSGFSWEGLGKGIVTVAALLGSLVVAMKLMATDSKGTVAAAYSMEVMASAMNLMSFAVKRLGSLNFETIVKGVGAIDALLIVVAAFQHIGGGEDLIRSATSLVIVGAAMNVIAIAVKNLGALPFGQIAKGVGAIAASLVVIAGAMFIMPPDLPITATGVLILSAALLVLSNALQSMGGMTWGEIAKGLVVLAGSLLILAVGVSAMDGALPGAAALIVIAAALTILVPVLQALGAMPWQQLLIGLGALVGIFVVLGAAGIVLAVVVPALLGLGAAIILIGGGVALAGVGVAAFAIGLTALSGAIIAAGGAMGIFVNGLLQLLPNAMTALAKGLTNFVVALGNDGVQIAGAFEKLAVALLNVVIQLAPKIGQAIQALLDTMLNLIRRNTVPIVSTMVNLTIALLNALNSRAGMFATAAANLIVNILNGITRNIPRIAQAGGNLVIAFINAIGNQAARIAAAGVQMVIRLVNSVANTIRGDSGEMHAAGANLASAIISGMVAGIGGGLGVVESAARSLASKALGAAKSFLGIHSPSKAFMDEVGAQIPLGAALGVDQNAHVLVNSVTKMGDSALGTMKDTLTSISDLVSGNMELNPTITPVVDLTQAKAGFNQLDALSKAQIAAASTNKAQSISADNAATAATLGNKSGGNTYEFNQYNTSPKALDAATIYRQTKNQLSVTKGALPS